jgi:hypothetical protein
MSNFVTDLCCSSPLDCDQSDKTDIPCLHVTEVRVAAQPYYIWTLALEEMEFALRLHGATFWF